MDKVPRQEVMLWIDDERPAPESWLWVKSSGAAIKVLSTGRVTEVSFDHDLGGDDTAYMVASWCEEMASRDLLKGFKWNVHSANPVGRIRITSAMISTERFWKTHESKSRARVEEFVPDCV